MKRKRAPRSTAKLASLDDFLTEESKREEFEAVAVKEVLAWRIAEEDGKEPAERDR